VQILADLERDFDFFGKRKRNMFRDLIFRGVGAGESGEVRRGGAFRGLDGNSDGGEGF